MCEANFKFEGYDFDYDFPAQYQRGSWQSRRGIIIYTNPDLRASQIDTGTYFEEMLVLKIPLYGPYALTLVGVYKSPNTTEDNEEALFKEMRRLSDTSSHLLVTGDFNYKGIDWVTWNVRPGTDETKCIHFLECVRDT